MQSGRLNNILDYLGNLHAGSLDVTLYEDTTKKIMGFQTLHNVEKTLRIKNLGKRVRTPFSETVGGWVMTIVSSSLILSYLSSKVELPVLNVSSRNSFVRPPSDDIFPRLKVDEPTLFVTRLNLKNQPNRLRLLPSSLNCLLDTTPLSERFPGHCVSD